MTNVYLETDTRGFMGRYSQRGKPLWLKPPQTLAEAVELAVEQVDANCLCNVSGARAGTVFQPRTLLGMPRPAATLRSLDSVLQFRAIGCINENDSPT